LVVVREFDPRENPGIYLIATDDSSSKQLFSGLTEPYIDASPASDKIAFVANKSADVHMLTLFALDLSSGGDAVDLLRDSDFPFHSISDPVWSPDGKQLAFIATIPGESNTAVSTLFVANPQTYTIKELVKGVRGPLAWSPTGYVVATTMLSSTQGIYQVNVETGNVQKLTDDELTSSMIFEWR
jgi:Tol biopolymer transport system component